MTRSRWFAVRQELTPRRSRLLGVLAFLLPLAVWSLFSYVPWLWHPMIRITAPGDVSWMTPGMLLDRNDFTQAVSDALGTHTRPPTGIRANPIYFPAPHEVARALYTAFTTPPVLSGDLWLHQSLWLSVQTIFWGFAISSVIGIPVGILCGSFVTVSRVTEPFVDFVRYMPAPAFGALMVAIFGIELAPKIAIIVIGTFFQQVLVVANTVRKVDAGLVEAAQTLGAKRRHLILSVVVPASLPDLYNDTRILLGWAWTYLIVAEVVGVSSGISFFINQQAKYRNFDNVYAAIIIIGILGLSIDQVLAFVGRRLFPWKNPHQSRVRAALFRLLRLNPDAGKPTQFLPS